MTNDAAIAHLRALHRDHQRAATFYSDFLKRPRYVPPFVTDEWRGRVVHACDVMQALDHAIAVLEKHRTTELAS